jgi:membrane protein implicated in regulation of membrane protease activity
MKTRLLGLLIALMLVLGLSVPAFAATTADVTITWTGTVIAMTNSEATWTIGSVNATATYWWTTAGTAPAPEPFEADDMKSTVTNTGNVAEDFDVHGHNSTGGAGWTLSADDSPAANEFSIRAGRTGTTNEAAMIQVITTETEIISNLAAAGTMKICLELETGTITVPDAQTTTITLTARIVS